MMGKDINSPFVLLLVEQQHFKDFHHYFAKYSPSFDSLLFSENFM
jgi:hypothetical protein